jgi:hypothetical protein
MARSPPPGKGGGVCARDPGGLCLCEREEREGGSVFVQQRRGGARERRGGGGSVRVNFGKTVYKNFGRKLFSLFLQRVFRLTEIIFRLTAFYNKTNIRKC